MPAYIIKRSDGYVYPRTDALAKKPGMEPFNGKLEDAISYGKRLLENKQEEIIEDVIEPVDEPIAIQKDDEPEMTEDEVAELREKAKSLGVKYSHVKSPSRLLKEVEEAAA